MFETFEENCLQLKVAYDAAAQSHADADETSYTDSKSTTAQRGRAIQLRNVAFRYPGATALALKNINLTIEPGQLVAVVGKNGSGKSTLMNILTSMLEPTSGELLINSQPSTSYRLRERTAILSQQPRAFPLSVSENIGIGMAEDIHNADMIKAAAQKGGVDLSNERELFDEWLKHMDRPVSGGELQRIGVARTFMRLNARDSTGDDPLVDLVVLDEPDSATDPQAEKLIIDNFVRERQGRTMMVVTHKFGHLTKAADVIVCMKDGEICELGTHTELLALQGEYASLYKVQAEAYADA
ncbi:P-loop containing nucleoside triphosphate hydrolase protein [Mucidula mucida]|nr:P-loop containing nucleoside triphosphate hydrolase protein [Mucidula mucida]